MKFEQQMADKLQYTENVIKKYMPKDASFQKTVIEAMDYTMSAGGKRIRPVLMQSVYELLGGSEEYVEPFMAAIEMIHTYSLIHDDLPALDNDDYRRGRKTAHIVYGEAMAILAGDSLLNYAFETASKAFSMVAVPVCLDNESILEEDKVTLLLEEVKTRRNLERAMEVLTAKPGIYGMIGGQVADVELTGSPLTNEQLNYIYENKTGALIEASMMIGAVLAGADDAAIAKVYQIAANVGMAFQIQDDILDETATFEELGKPIHSDEKNEKVTFVTIHGIEASKTEVERLSKEACELLATIDGESDFLRELILYLIHRKN